MMPLPYQPGRRAFASIAVATAIFASVSGLSSLPASEGSAAASGNPSQPARAYRVDTIDLPDGIDSEVGALTFNEAGELIVVTRHSGILIGTPSSDGSRSTFQWRTFCDQILDNPVGVLAEPGGTLLVAQRHELTRLHDTDEDGLADYFEAVAATESPITAGTQPDGEGNWMLAMAIGKGRARWQGWSVTAGPDGVLTPLSSGIHQAGGIATDFTGNFFATDTAGEWNAEHALQILEKNLFHGDPAALLWDREFVKQHADPLAWAKNNPNDLAAKTVASTLRIPAGEFCSAPGGLAFHLGDDDSFGPFSGQCFVTDSASPDNRLMRVMLESVDGKWQGSITRFHVEGLSGANAHRLCFSPDGTQLYVGQTRGSNDAEASPKLQRITAAKSGKGSFALRNVSTQPAGLQISFTAELNRTLATDAKNYTIQRHPGRGGDPDSTTPSRAVITPDGRTVTLFFDTGVLAPGFRYAIDLAKLKSHAGNKIAHGSVHHTIQHLPGDLTVTIPHPKPRPEDEEADKKEQAEDDSVKTGNAPEMPETSAPISEKKG